MKLPSGRVKILDFGLAREVNDSTQITEAGFLIGTPAFLSPEQARGKPADHLSDLFSFGCVLYRLCTRNLPFPAQNNLDQLAAITSDDPPPPQRFNPNLPPAFVALLLQLLDKDPRRRPQSAAEVAERLQQIKKQATGRARRNRSERLDISLPRQPFMQRHAYKLLAAGAVLLAIATIVVTVMLVLPSQDNVPEVKRKEPGDAAQKQLPKPLDKAPVFLVQMKPMRTLNWPFEGKAGKDKGKDKGGKDKGGFPPGVDGRVFVQGVQSTNGIFMHPAPREEPASITYALDRKYRTFTARVALNDTGVEGGAAVTFRVFGDDPVTPLWQSKPVQFRRDTQEVSVSVKDMNSLRIQVDAAGDPKGAHAVWIEPRLE